MFYGWVIVAVSFLTQFLISGCVFYVFGVVLKELVEEFGGGRFGVSGILMVMPWVGALIAPFVGRMAGQGHLRMLITVGTLATGVGLLWSTRATDLWQLYAIFSTLIVLGANTMSGVCSSALVVNWFTRRRALAVGISQIGASAGGMVMGPVAALLLEDLDWRELYAFFGWMMLACVPLVWWLTVGRPEDRGLAPDGAAISDEGSDSPPSPTPVFDTRAALRNRNLWLIAFVTGSGFMISSSVVAHSVALATDAGLDALSASWLLSLIAAGAVLGKLVFGELADRAGERPAFYISLVLQIAGLLGVTELKGEVSLFLSMAVLGLGIGGVLPLSAVLLARVFGPAAFAPVMGLMAPLFTPLVSVGPPFAGWVFDRTGSYDLAYWTFAGILAVAVVMLGRIELPTSNPESP
ncbi:MFS transporter [Myxococcota bacterium]|nr:MFS transporter [Myxococcota bacterium]